MAKLHQIRSISRIRQNRCFDGTPISNSIALCKILSKSPFSPDSSKSPLRRYPYLELNRSLVKFLQIRHSCRIRRNRRNCRFVSTPFSSSIALRRNFVKIAILILSPDSSKSPLCLYPYLELNRSSAKFRHYRQIHRICQNRHFVGTPISSSIALRRNSSKSPFSPNLPDSSKSPLRWYPHLELNHSMAKFVKIAILVEIAGFIKISALLVPLS